MLCSALRHRNAVPLVTSWHQSASRPNTKGLVLYIDCILNQFCDLLTSRCGIIQKNLLKIEHATSDRLRSDRPDTTVGVRVQPLQEHGTECKPIAGDSISYSHHLHRLRSGLADTTLTALILHGIYTHEA